MLINFHFLCTILDLIQNVLKGRHLHLLLHEEQPQCIGRTSNGTQVPTIVLT